MNWAAIRQVLRTRNLFWRVVFWFVVLRLAFWGVGAAFMIGDARRGDWREELKTLRELDLRDLRELGLLKAGALWLFLNTPWMFWAFMIAALPAAFLLYKLAVGRPKPKGNVTYLSTILCTAAIYAGAVAYLAQFPFIRTSHASYGFEGGMLSEIPLGDLFFAAPAILMLLGGILIGWHGPPTGSCLKCGYNLTGNASGVCPECGTPVPSKPEVVA
jgi:hypothetical protein